MAFKSDDLSSDLKSINNSQRQRFISSKNRLIVIQQSCQFRLNDCFFREIRYITVNSMIIQHFSFIVAQKDVPGCIISEENTDEVCSQFLYSTTDSIKYLKASEGFYFINYLKAFGTAPRWFVLVYKSLKSVWYTFRKIIIKKLDGIRDQIRKY